MFFISFDKYTLLRTDVIPYVSRLFIYPIKSLDRVSVESINVLKSGALERDREFAIVDKLGNLVQT
ncbi:hypothetical protein DSM106972_057440 [Dulcicalothrix desertica PCC 7102]|uniref:Molybdenum cofactor sulfurase middle domain-containing protein n=1 Tax=Dulcicalothrix desertica PCC 7102 TaxID=232991 RepID=A0A3S1AK54_9CYAN|nr:hypothetical protein DSM106972_057440 [Dulcicalothrix desertica PCC 7102]